MSDDESEVSIASDEEFDFVASEEEDDDGDFMDADDDEENVSSAKSKGKAKAAPKKRAPAKAKGGGKAKAKTALANKTNTIEADTDEEGSDSDVEQVTASKSKKSNKTVEERYQKKTQLEHILLRPDTYIGSTEPTTETMHVLDSTSGNIVQKEITFTPGLYKIFDEIVVNAADNKQRDPDMSELHIEVNAEENLVSVKNNGKGIPVEMHKDEKCFVPTLIFGHLLTGSNFDDNEKKTTGGRNGYGAKLANIFSTEFTVECLDSENGKKFKQVFRDNMGVAEEPMVKNTTKTENKKGDFVKISFRPDLARFQMDKLDDDTVALLSKRAYDIAGSMANRHGKKLSVFLNGEKLKVKSFKEYLGKIEGVNDIVAFDKVNDEWEVGVAASEGTGTQQISFVNAICTSKGGGHVQYILDQVSAHLLKVCKKKAKGKDSVKMATVKNHLCIFVNCLVTNPSFDSQTKENCTTKSKSFGSGCKLSDKFLKAVEKGPIVESILSFSAFKENQALKRKGGAKKVRIQGIAKLDDANNAGGAKSKDCTLIVTEGDSAKTLAMSGLSVVGRDNYGVFPLRGKPLNVRDAATSSITKNEEIKNLVQILGLKFGTVYDENNIKTLRYGHLMIMADQDHDGSHIKGLIINFIHKFWPSLLDVPGFLQQFITPIVKATKGRQSKVFFTLPEMQNWMESEDSKGWNIKYYKGLGTSTSEEAKDYFANLDKHEILFGNISEDVEVIDGAEDDDIVPDKAASGSDLIDMVFRKDRVEDRKTWLNNLDAETYLDYSEAQDSGVRYSDFINREFILFSKSDNMRSIPHSVDGFKPSQRKILFACFKKNLKKEIKVAQLAGYVGEKSAYHHGEASLHGTITNMAQNFVGSNNVNLLTPSGQFGTRRMGGKDAASPRYIFTKLEPITRTIFHPDDDALLNYLEDDGMSIEPEFYVPVIPLVLVNGSDGIGTGWSSTIPNYCPRALIENLRMRIRGEEEIPQLSPEYYGFNGTIDHNTEKAGNQYVVQGKIERVKENELLIDELPIKKWTQDYKTFLEGMLHGDDKKGKPAEIKDFRENHTDTTVSFTIIADPAKIDEFEKFKAGLYGKFKLTTTLSTNNMNLFDTEGRITKYNSAEDILSAFYDLRLEYYVKRKALLVEKLGREKRILDNKARFVEEVCSGDLVVSNRKRKDILADLQERGYELFPPQKGPTNEEENEEEEDDTASDADLAKGYEYLLGMKIWSLTFEKAQKLRELLAEKTKELEDLMATEPTQIWLNDLEAVEAALDDRDEELKKLQAKEKDARAQASKNQKKKSAAAAKKAKAKGKGRGKKRKDEWDSEMEDSDDDGNFSEVEVISKKPTTKRGGGKTAAASKPKPKAAAKKPAAATKKSVLEAPSNDAEDSDAGDSVGSKKRKESPEEDVEVVEPKKAKKAPAKKAVSKKKTITETLDDTDDEEDDVEVVEPKKAKTAAAKKALAKKAVSKKQAITETLDDTDDEEDKAPPPKKKAAAAKKAAPKKAPAKKAPAKKKKVVVDSEDEEDFDGGASESESEDSVEEVAPPPPRARGGRARKQITYNVDSDSEEEADDPFEFDD